MSIEIRLLATLITSFILCYISIPSIIKISQVNGLGDSPNKRKHHEKIVPNLGGIAIFGSFLFSLLFWSNDFQIIELKYIIAAIIIIFFTGFKDDIVNLVSYKKLAAQVMAAFIVIYFADIRLTSMYGLFGIHEIPHFFSIALSLFTVVVITNAFNLIDGIDMLAASTAIISTSTFTLWFFLIGKDHYALLGLALIGSLIAFAIYNKTPAKIFMGDTGSMLIGLISAILVIKFIEMNRFYVGPQEFKIRGVPAVGISILILPLFDTLRVFSLRALEKKSPLSPDRKHLHHLLVDSGITHMKATAILSILSIFIIMFSFISSKILSGEMTLLISIVLMSLFSFFLSSRIKKVVPQS